MEDEMIVILLIDLLQIASHVLSHTPTFISEEKIMNNCLLL
jgi:hypothetical protein